MVKKASLKSVKGEWEREYRDLALLVYGDNSHIDKSQVLDQTIGAIWLFDG